MKENNKQGINRKEANLKLKEATMKERVRVMANYLEQQIVDGLTDEAIRTKMNMTKSTFYRMKNYAELEVQRRAELRQKKINEVIITGAVEAVERGLKSKTDRVLILQDQVEEILRDLEAETYTAVVPVKHPVTGVTSMEEAEMIMTPMQKAYLRKTLKELQAEISRIEGDYAATQVSVQHSFYSYLQQASIVPSNQLQN